MRARDARLQAVLVTALRAFSAMLTLAVSLVVARSFGAQTNGLLLLAMAVISIVGMVSSLGLPDPVMRHVAVSAAGGGWTDAALTMRHAMRLTALAVSASALVVLLSLHGIDSADENRFLVIAVLALPAVSLLQLYARGLTGLSRPLIGEFWWKAGVQLVLLICVVGGALLSERSAIPVGLVAGYWIGFVACWFVWRKTTSHVGSDIGSSAIGTGRLLQQGLPVMFSSSLALLPQWIDVLMISGLIGTAQAGVYGVAVRVAALIGLVLVGANAVAGPRFAKLYSKGDLPALRTLVAVVNTWTMAASMVAFVGLLVFSRLFGTIFGPEFNSGERVLVIAAVGQLFHASFGVVALLLIMTGQARRVLLASVVAVSLNLLLNLLLIPRFGISGAAWASVASVLAANIVSAVSVYRTLAIRPLRFQLVP